MKRALSTLLPAISLLLLATGCVHSARVFEKRPTAGDPYATQKLKGIPFYGKKEAFKQTTTYQKSWYEITLSVSEVENGKSKGEPSVMAKWVPLTVECQKNDDHAVCMDERCRCPTKPTLDRLKDKVGARAQRTLEEKEEIEKEFKALPQTGGEAEADEQMISNYVEPVLVVDYTRELYLNAWLPWFGSSTLTSKLAADGTLTEATVTTESKLPEAISTLIPLKEFLTAEAIPPVAADAAAAESTLMMAVPEADRGSFEEALEEFLKGLRPPAKFQLSLEIAVTGYSYEFSAVYPTDPRQATADCPEIPSPCEWPGCEAQLWRARGSSSAVARQRAVRQGVDAAAPWGSAIYNTSTQPGVTSVEGACKLEPLKFDPATGNYKRAALAAKPKPKEPSKKITVSGDIVLPEEKKK